MSLVMSTKASKITTKNCQGHDDPARPQTMYAFQSYLIYFVYSDGQRYRQENSIYKDVCRLKALKAELSGFIEKESKNLKKLHSSKAVNREFVKEANTQALKELEDEHDKEVEEANAKATRM